MARLAHTKREVPNKRQQFKALVRALRGRGDVQPPEALGGKRKRGVKQMARLTVVRRRRR